MKGFKCCFSVLLMVFILSFIHVDCVRADYSASAAVDYAKVHCASNHSEYSSNCPNGWLCAEFVANCVKAGGANITPSNLRVVRNLYYKLAEIGTVSELEISTATASGGDRYIKATGNNAGKIADGDVIITYCSRHDVYLHAILVSGISSDGSVYAYGHNGNMFGRKVTASRACKGINYAKESYSDIKAYVIHFGNSGNTSAPAQTQIYNQRVRITVPAGYRLQGYQTAESYTNYRYIEAVTYSYTLNASKYAVLPNGAVRYYYIDNQGYGLWFDHYSGMNVCYLANSLSVNKSSLVVERGERVVLEYGVSPENITECVYVASDNNNCAYASINGNKVTVTGNSAGRTTIYVYTQYSQIKVPISVTVVEPETEAPKPETEAPQPETEAPKPETEAPEPESGNSGNTSTVQAQIYNQTIHITVPAGYRIQGYQTAASYTKDGYIEAKTYSYTLKASKYAVLSNGAVRYYYVDSRGNDIWFDHYNGMSIYYLADSLSVNKKSLVIERGERAVLEYGVSPEHITEGVYVSSDNSTCAYAAINGNKVIVTGNRAGKTTIYVYTKHSQIKVPISVTVVEPETEAPKQETPKPVVQAFTVKAASSAVYYNGKAQTPKVTVYANGAVVSSSYYNISYSNNTKPGTATITVTGKGTYSGISGKATFTIKENAFKVKVGTKSYTYNGKAKKPKITVYAGSKKISSKYYTVSYKNNKNVGIATVQITGKGSYKYYSAAETFSIKLKKPSVSSVKSSKKQQMTVKWKKDTQGQGYQLQYSTNKKFKSSVSNVDIKGNSKTSNTISKLKSKKTYYVRIRTYKYVNGDIWYGPWSSVKKVKIK